jgi:hypothetical protein
VEELKEDSGADSIQKRILCERAGFLMILLETQEVNALEKGQIEIGPYVQGINALVGLLRHLGLKRVTKSASLSQYIEQKGRQTA